MARKIVVQYRGAESAFGFAKLSRDKLYDSRQRIVLDHDGRPCERVGLTQDGSMIVHKGMTAQGYFDEAGRAVDRRDLVGLGPDGEVLERLPSTLDVPQPLEGPVPPEAVLDLAVSKVYMLDEADAEPSLVTSLRAGDVYRFGFNFSSGFEHETGFLLANEHGLFALIGAPLELTWSEPRATTVEDYDDAVLDGDDLDFNF